MTNADAIFLVAERPELADDLTESPIEAGFLAALCAILIQSDLPVRPYLQATIGRYRVDFLLAEVGCEPGDEVWLVVECDGHDWHDRTKEQAAGDRERDRMLLCAGYPVVRFTGSEIHADAERCAEEALGALEALRERRRG